MAVSAAGAAGGNVSIGVTHRAGDASLSIACAPNTLTARTTIAPRRAEHQPRIDEGRTRELASRLTGTGNWPAAAGGVGIFTPSGAGGPAGTSYTLNAAVSAAGVQTSVSAVSV